MATTMRSLTNDYAACKLVKLDSNDSKSPLVVMQEGYLMSDPNCRMRMFYLQRDGCWIDEIARSTLPDTRAGEVVFETANEALQLLSGLTGKPQVNEVPVTEADVRTYVARVQGGDPADLFRNFLARYRANKGSA